MPDNVFASFFNYGPRLTPGSLISLYPSVTDPTGQITAADPTQLVLAPGYYLISYSVSATFSSPNYLQVTPTYNGTSQLVFGVYSATNADGFTASGSAHLVVPAPSGTTFTLTYSGSGTASNGQVTMHVLQLRRSD